MVLAKPIGNGLLELLRLLKKFHRIAFTDDARRVVAEVVSSLPAVIEVIGQGIERRPHSGRQREKRVVVSPTGLFDTVAGSADGYRGERAGRVVGHAEPAVGR